MALLQIFDFRNAEIMIQLLKMVAVMVTATRMDEISSTAHMACLA
jgi:hypothetical protein